MNPVRLDVFWSIDGLCSAIPKTDFEPNVISNDVGIT